MKSIAPDMTDRDFREFVRLRELAHHRFAEESLARALQISLDEQVDEIERQRRLFALVAERRHEQFALFEDYRRATASLRLMLMLRQGLLRRTELVGLSLTIRRRVMAAD